MRQLPFLNPATKKKMLQTGSGFPSSVRDAQGPHGSQRHPWLCRYMLRRCVCWGRSCSGPGKREMFPAAAPTALQHCAVCWGQCLNFGLQNPDGFCCVPVRVWESQGEGQGITKVRGRQSEASVVFILVSYSYSHTLVCPDPGSVSASPLTAHQGRAAQSCFKLSMVSLS